MSKSTINRTLRQSAGLSGRVANKTAGCLMSAIAQELRQRGRFILPGLGTLVVCQTPERSGFNPRTGARLHVQAGQTVRFRASRVFRAHIQDRSQS